MRPHCVRVEAFSTCEVVSLLQNVPDEGTTAIPPAKSKAGEVYILINHITEEVVSIGINYRTELNREPACSAKDRDTLIEQSPLSQVKPRLLQFSGYGTG